MAVRRIVANGIGVGVFQVNPLIDSFLKTVSPLLQPFQIKP